MNIKKIRNGTNHADLKLGLNSTWYGENRVLAIQIEEQNLLCFLANPQLSWASSSFTSREGHRSQRKKTFIMESRYGIGINNRYAFFLDSEDGYEIFLLLSISKIKPHGS